MNNEYYGVRTTPTDDYLAHYGVKGMKWGVRKAIEKGNTKALDRHYRKAAKKLEKLSKRTDIEAQTKKAKRYGKLATVGGAFAGAGLGGVVSSSIAVRKLLDHAGNLNASHKALGDTLDKKDSAIIRDAERRLKLTAQGGKYNSYRSPYERDMAFDKLGKDFNQSMNDSWNEYKTKSDALKSDLDRTLKKIDTATSYGRIMQGVGALGLLGAGIAGGKALRARYRTTQKGHAKAVADRDAWKNQMAETFKGTKYSNLPDYGQVRRKKNKIRG